MQSSRFDSGRGNQRKEVPDVALDDIITQLAKELADIDAQVEALGVQRDRIAAAHAALTGTPVQPTIVLQLPAEGSRELTLAKSPPDPGIAEKKPKVAEGISCPECGLACKGPIGLGIHRKKTHGVNGATKAPKPEPVSPIRATARPVAITPDDAREMLEAM
jgi:hypothetical protein